MANECEWPGRCTSGSDMSTIYKYSVHIGLAMPANFWSFCLQMNVTDGQIYSTIPISQNGTCSVRRHSDTADLAHYVLLSCGQQVMSGFPTNRIFRSWAATLYNIIPTYYITL